MTPSRQSVIQALLQPHIGDITSITPVSGGDINEAYRIETPEGVWFLKMHANAPRHLFTEERKGLEALYAASTSLRIPQVRKVGEGDMERPAWLLLEWIEPGEPDEQTAEPLGRGLAAIHRRTASTFGWDTDNFIGLLPQLNTPSHHWPLFWRDCRLLPQYRLAEKRHLLPPGRQRRMERLLERLNEWLDTPDAVPSLLHGDLWSGNWFSDTHRRPCLVDPASYFGHREVDLAMTQLFGGFPPRFYDAYRESYPLDPGYEERRPLYQLYYLWVHLNLFGEGYGASVDRILKRYVGS